MFSSNIESQLRGNLYFLRDALLGLSVLKCHLTVLKQATLAEVSLWLLLTILKTFGIFGHNLG